ncbi:MAG: Mycofactocin system glycosyltransferase, partial [uncultured Nocardioides sp.]
TGGPRRRSAPSSPAASGARWSSPPSSRASPTGPASARPAPGPRTPWATSSPTASTTSPTAPACGGAPGATARPRHCAPISPGRDPID